MGNEEEYIKRIAELPIKETYSLHELLTDDYLMDQQGNLSIYYSPHNQYVNNRAIVLILGITPGWKQMEQAIRTMRQLLTQNLNMETILEEVKRQSRFYGRMRINLIDMLNEVRLHQFLGLSSSEELFKTSDYLLHTCSLIKYPVFKQQTNYSGHNPYLTKSSFLMNYVQDTFETNVLPNHKSLIIPLGKVVEDVLYGWLETGSISKEQCLFGFPHPSGSNGHRLVQLYNRKDELIKKISNFFP